MNSSLNRRRFLLTSTGVLAAPYFLRSQGSPNNKLNIGCIGTAGRAWSDIEGVKGENIVALCDVDETNLNKAGEKFPGAKKHPIDVAATLSVPVLGLYGADDTGIPIETVEKMQTALSASGSRSTIHIYPGTPHAFHADYRPSYRKVQAEDGWQRCLAWLRAHGMK